VFEKMGCTEGVRGIVAVEDGVKINGDAAVRLRGSERSIFRVDVYLHTECT
jgi:hypothetical protein